MSDILLNEDGDIDITNGVISLIDTEQEYTKQRLAIKLRTYRGEWYLDTSEGIPYFQTIFRKSQDPKGTADTIFKTVINADEGVVSLDSFESSLSSSGVYTMTFTITATTGDIVTVAQSLNF